MRAVSPARARARWAPRAAGTTRRSVASASSRAVAVRARTAVKTDDDADDVADDFEWYRKPSRVAIAGAWATLGAVAAFAAPSGTSGFDAELVKTIVTSPFGGVANPVFEALFNALGVVPATYACLLLPGAKGQKLPAALCVGASFALGFFAVGPYLATRAPRTTPAPRRSELGWVTRNVWESKLNAVALLGFASFLAYYGVSNLSPENVSGFIALIREQSMLACVSTCDLVVLSACMVDAIGEDMKRRNVDPSGALAYAAVPVVGPALWLVLRPSLEE
ncbi:unnamed product [Ostreococcus tauri]|uniref:Unnamed product n=1 Tax=Ostreococcus tauri TaxID=70448 RepID=A0A090M5R2_OSTTA|nr:unnamed product [Ostreococcus tauri]CEF97429.1 unnamed product [Ostreococcus tauri]|eukprot:XP_003078581.2 unnamed product [Ostreococcus tauri]